MFSDRHLDRSSVFRYFTSCSSDGTSSTDSAVLVGDSQIAISLNNLAAYTFANYHEFLWWDPTGLDGYPALVNLTHGWFNYLNPLILPGHLFVWGVTSLLHWPLVTAVQVQLFSCG